MTTRKDGPGEHRPGAKPDGGPEESDASRRTAPADDAVHMEIGERKGSKEREPEEPHGESEAV